MINLIKGDITKIKCDVIVNAANSSLLGGSGVDGAIHRAGGKKILEECQKIRNKQGGCKVGNAVITGGGNLFADKIIHAVGPNWSGGNNNEEDLLKKTYESCFKLAKDNNLKKIAFPNISTGIYKFPKKRAAEIAIEITLKYINKFSIESVIFVCFEEENYSIYKNLLK